MRSQRFSVFSGPSQGDVVPDVSCYNLGVGSSSRVRGSLAGPFPGMAYALALASCLKVGTGMAVLPGRHRVPAPRRVLPVCA
jgi:hypothetical protein